MALRNLVGNAVKFTERGEVAIRVRRIEGHVEFVVTDTGIGIPSEALPRLFEPFTQAHGMESRRKGGAGLGLHLVKRLAELLGGTVSVDTEVGHGSTFRLRLPLQPDFGPTAIPKGAIGSVDP
jgi:signal transduction histidine kinase